MIHTPTSRLFVAGHAGLVGSAILRRLEAEGFTNLLTATPRPARPARPGGGQLLVQGQPPRVRLPGGRHRRRHPGQLHPAGRVHLRQHDDPRHRGPRRPPVRRRQAALPRQLLHLPARLAPSRCTEESLLTGPLEPTNESYAIAKIAGIKLCQSYRRQYGCDFISAMPTNLYGPNDNFDLESSHVLPALIRKFHDAAASSGRPTSRSGAPARPAREFLHVDDLADACLFLMEQLRRRPPHQRRHRRGPHHPRARRDGPRRRPPRGRADLRHLQARRHPPQAARRHPPPRPRLETQNLDTRRHRLELPMVFGEQGQPLLISGKACRVDCELRIANYELALSGIESAWHCKTAAMASFFGEEEALPCAFNQRFQAVAGMDLPVNLPPGFIHISDQPAFRRDFALRDQIRRASISAMSTLPRDSRAAPHVCSSIFSDRAKASAERSALSSLSHSIAVTWTTRPTGNSIDSPTRSAARSAASPGTSSLLVTASRRADRPSPSRQFVQSELQHVGLGRRQFVIRNSQSG